MCTGDTKKPSLSPASPYTHILGALRLQEHRLRGWKRWHASVSAATRRLKTQPHHTSVVFMMRGIQCGEAAEILHNLGNWALVSYPCANYCLCGCLRGSSMSSNVNQSWRGIFPTGDQSQDERSVYTTPKIAAVCAKSSCLIKAESFEGDLLWCASSAPLSDEAKLKPFRLGVQLQSQWLCGCATCR